MTDFDPRGPYRRRILSTTPMEGFRCGWRLKLDCGHEAVGFGDLSHLDGTCCCLVCLQEKAEHAEQN